MKILFNATNLKIGGGVQKAYEFVHSIIEWGGGHEWLALLSNEVAANLDMQNMPAHLSVQSFEHSPARRREGRETRSRVDSLVREFKPDICFSLLGPSYLKLPQPHVTGYAVPWMTQPADRETWRRSYPGWRKWRMKLWLLWQRAWIGGHAAYICETTSDAEGLSRVLNRPLSDIHVIPNSCSNVYLQKGVLKTPPHPKLADLPEDARIILTFAGAHPHKNHAILPVVASALKRKDPKTEWRLIVTLLEGPWGELKASASGLGVEEMLVNIGPVRAVEGPSLYVRAEVMLLPTLMEVFSASYPEAMAMQVPIITSDRPFAHDVCGEAACYADPLNGEALADEILRVTHEENLRKELVKRGMERLAAFGTAEQRFRSHLEVFASLTNR